MGLDSVRVFDHLLFRFPDQPQFRIDECWTVLAALADATERVELGTLVKPLRGPEHLIVDLQPPTPVAIDHLAEAVAVSRRLEELDGACRPARRTAGGGPAAQLK